MNLLTVIQNFIQRDAEKYASITITSDNVNNGQSTPTQPAAESGYFRIWLSEMFVKEDQIWGKPMYPIANALVTFMPPESTQEKTIPYILKIDEEKVKVKGVFKAFPITGLIPFRGGTVRIQSYLSTVTGDGVFEKTIDILEGFNKLAMGAAESSIEVARMLKSGIDSLYGAVSGTLRLGFDQTFTVEDLQPGYRAILNARDGKYTPSRFSVIDQRLYYRNVNNEVVAFDECDHLLMRIEYWDHHENWETIPQIKKLFDAVCEAYAKDKEEDAKVLRQSLMLAIYETPSLVRRDRARVKEAVKAELEACMSKESATMESAPIVIDTIMHREMEGESIAAFVND